ncbi:hypothetical protein VF13_39785 [Nostoc linckia z16]|nr:hypothetical protein VF13_39785 [Nostoc linckia z16]
MTKLLLLFNLIFFSSTYAQDCKGLSTGTFKIETTFTTFTIERKNGYQLESNNEFGVVYLQRIEPISDCEYNLIRFEVIEFGQLPKPDMHQIMNTKVTNVVDSNYYFISHLISSSINYEGVLEKIDDNVSEKFEQILNNIR